MKVTPGWPCSFMASASGIVSIWLLASSTICCTVFLILSGIERSSDAYLYVQTAAKPRLDRPFDFAQGRFRDGRFRIPHTKSRTATAPPRDDRPAAARPADRRRVRLLCCRCASPRRSSQSSMVPSPRPSHSRPTRSACSSSLKRGDEGPQFLLRRRRRECASSTEIIRSSAAFDPESGSVTTSCTSNSRALTMMKQTLSDEIVSVGSAIAHLPCHGTEVRMRGTAGVHRRPVTILFRFSGTGSARPARRPGCRPTAPASRRAATASRPTRSWARWAAPSA